jgi:hypothetical protein
VIPRGTNLGLGQSFVGRRHQVAVTELALLVFFFGQVAEASPYSYSGFLLLKATTSSPSALLVSRSRSLRMVFGLTHPIWWTRVSHVVPSWKTVMT